MIQESRQFYISQHYISGRQTIYFNKYFVMFQWIFQYISLNISIYFNTFQQCMFQGGRQQTTLSFNQLLPRLCHICSGPSKALASVSYDTMCIKEFMMKRYWCSYDFCLVSFSFWRTGGVDQLFRIIVTNRWDQIHQL